jgi:arylformamidase
MFEISKNGGSDTENDVTRRKILAGSICATVALTASPAAAQRCPAPPRAKGPLVWLDMDQKELDDAYTQAVYAPFRDQTNSPRLDQANAIARTKIAPPESLAYGAPERERVLLYRARSANAPTLIFLHGGAWQNGRAGQPAMAECITKAGANFIAVDFNNVGETGGDIGKMVDQCRRAVAWLYRNGR